MEIIKSIKVNGKLVPLSQYEKVDELLACVTKLAAFCDPKDFTSEQWNSLKKVQKAFRYYNFIRQDEMNDPFDGII